MLTGSGELATMIRKYNGLRDTRTLLPIHTLVVFDPMPHPMAKKELHYCTRMTHDVELQTLIA